MRYELDLNGYVLAVYWGCHSGNCAEYTGTVPSGYTDLNDWSENALINAYYIENGNLVLDTERLKELETKIEQDTIDNEPVLRKDLYGTTNVLETQYKSETATGQVIAIDNVKKINPKVKITNVNTYDKIEVITQTKNMLVNDGESKTISGVAFIRNNDGSIYISGTATANIEYNLAGSGTNTTSIFVLKKDLDYYLNLDGLECGMNFYDGTTSQVYAGTDGVINLNESKEVTQVLIKIPTGTVIDKTIYPMLEYGSLPSEYEANASMKLTIDLSNYASADYITIEDGLIYVSSNNELSYLGKGNVNLFDGNNTVYTLQDTSIEMTYFINDMNLEGTSTANNSFRIDEEGNITATGGTIGGFTVDGDKLYSYITTDYDYGTLDIVKIQKYLLGTGTLTEEEIIKYDIDGDGVVTEQDKTSVQKLIIAKIDSTHPGKIEIDATNTMKNIKVYNGLGEITNSIGLWGIEASSVSTDALSIGGENFFDNFSYKDGDGYFFDVTDNKEAIWTGGTLTSGRTEIICTIFLPKSVESINSISLGLIKWSVRSNLGSYLLNGSTSKDGINIYKSQCNNAVTLVYTTDTAFSTSVATNNTPVSVCLSRISMTFHE